MHTYPFSRSELHGQVGDDCDGGSLKTNLSMLVTDKGKPKENKPVVHARLYFGEENLFLFNPGHCPLPKIKHVAKQKSNDLWNKNRSINQTFFYWQLLQWFTTYSQRFRVSNMSLFILKVRIANVSSSFLADLGAVKVMLKGQLKQRKSAVKSYRLQTKALTHPLRPLRTDIFWQHRRGKKTSQISIIYAGGRIKCMAHILF